jgi:hypothetical protein
MGKVYGIHEIVVHPGIDEESFVRFFNHEMTSFYENSDWKLSLLKGDRGQRAGQYAVMYEVASREARDRDAPIPNQLSEEDKRWYEEHKEQADDLAKKWASFSPTDLATHLEYTDYLLLE